MLQLYTSPFSTFGRKVVLGLDLKGLRYETTDALRRDFREQLLALNPRAEVPVLVDDDLTVVNSSDILQYLDWQYPARLLYPTQIPDRVEARALERLADQRLDPLVVDISFWAWADRTDTRPASLKEAAQADLERVLQRLETSLLRRPRPWPFGEPGVVECAWFPNMAALKALGLKLDAERFPVVAAWYAAMRTHPVFVADRARTATFLQQLSSADHERQRLFWSGERIEWLLSKGFHHWFMEEIESGRVSYPG